MKKLIFLISMVLSVGLPRISWAHYFGPGQIFKVFQWPEGYEPVPDGNLEEWDVVPSSYNLSYEKHVWEPGGCIEWECSALYNFETGDFGILRVIAGWSESQNRLYFAAEILDDIHQIDRSPGDPTGKDGYGWLSSDDSITTMVDADHSGGQYSVFMGLSEEELKRLMGAQAQSYEISVPPPDAYPIIIWSAATWAWHSPWTEVAWHIEGDFQSTNTTFYELAITPFDDLHWAGPDSSRIHNLTEGEIIGLAYQLLDYDIHPTAIHGLYDFGGDRARGTADHFADFRLEPVEEGLFGQTPVEEITWGRIKASFKEVEP